MHQAHMTAMDQELAEIIAEEALLHREQTIKKHPSSPIAISDEALDILDQVSRKIENKNKQLPAKKENFWPTWDNYRNLDK